MNPELGGSLAEWRDSWAEWGQTSAGCSAERNKPCETAIPQQLGMAYRLRLSRISRNRTISSAGAFGSTGDFRLRRFICLTMMKIMKARMMKFRATVTKLP